MARGCGSVGGVEDRRGIEPDVAAFCEAGMSAVPGDMGGDFAFRDAAVAVGAGCDQERRIICIHRIEMEAQRQHAVEQRLRRGDVLDARLDGPWAEARRVVAFDHGDGAVLMPAERPVGRGALVEQDGADRAARLPLMRGGMAADRAGGGEEGGERGKAGEAQAGAVGGLACESEFDRRERGGVDGDGDVLRAVGGEGEGHFQQRLKRRGDLHRTGWSRLCRGII